MTLLLDANIILRFLRNDVPSHFKIAKETISKGQQGKAELYLDELVLAEVIWTSTTFYKETRETISKPLLKLLTQNWIINPRKELISEALNYYKNSNLSYIDCWLYTLSKEKNFFLETFDQKLKKLSKQKKLNTKFQN